MKKLICILAAMALSLCGCAETAGGLRIVALKTGKADAIIIHTANAAVLIDAGEDDDGDKVLEEAARRGIGKFDYLILTHYDKDHVGGAAEVIGGIEIGEVIEPGYPKDSREYSAYVQAAEAAGIPRTVPGSDLAFELDGAAYSVYMPKLDQYEDENDHSIVVKVEYDGHAALFTGDALDARTAELREYDISADVLKAPHHGSFEAGSKALFAQVSPQYAIIPCSTKNPADAATVAALEGLGCKVYTTAEGHIEIAFYDGQILTP